MKNFICLGAFLLLISSEIMGQNQTTNEIRDPCIGRENGFARDIRSCRHYFSCKNGIGSRGVCDGNNLFDAESENCVPFNQRNCFECPGDRGVHLLSVPHACNQYVQCWNTVPTLHLCPRGLVFDGREGFQQCNFPPSFGGCHREDSSPNCPPFNGTLIFLRDPTSCSRFYICTGKTVAERQSCPEGLHFNLGFNTCDHPENARCSTFQTTTTPSPSRPTPSPSRPTHSPSRPTHSPSRPTPPVRPVPGPAFPCSENVGQFVPCRVSCQNYYICSRDGRGHLQDCGNGNIFDFTTRRCTLPDRGECWATLNPNGPLLEDNFINEEEDIVEY